VGAISGSVYVYVRSGPGSRPGTGGRERPCGAQWGPFLAGSSLTRLVGSSVRPGDAAAKRSKGAGGRMLRLKGARRFLRGGGCPIRHTCLRSPRSSNGVAVLPESATATLEIPRTVLDAAQMSAHELGRWS